MFLTKYSDMHDHAEMRKKMSSLLIAIIYLAFISLGLPDSLIGSAWPVMHTQLNVPTSYAGIVTMLIAGGTIVSSLFSDRLTRKFGAGMVTSCSVLLTALALMGFSVTHSFAPLCIWAIPYGLGAGAIDAALNNYVALHFKARHMSWLHCFWGLGTIISPYVMSYALTTSVWQNGYRMVSFIQIGIALILFVTLPIWKVNKKETAQEEKAEEEMVGIKGALKIKGVPNLLLGFFSYCALESAVILWGSSYLVGAKGISAERAAAFASLFCIGITLGRFLAGFITEKMGDHKMIRLGIAIILVGCIGMLLPVSIDEFALFGLVIMGLGCAPIYPSIIHATPSNFGEKNSQAIIGIQMASAYVGSTFMPPLFGLIANHISVGLLPVYVLFFLILMFFMLEKTFKLVK